jgi:hypothetical protein
MRTSSALFRNFRTIHISTAYDGYLARANSLPTQTILSYIASALQQLK